MLRSMMTNGLSTLDYPHYALSDARFVGALIAEWNATGNVVALERALSWSRQCSAMLECALLAIGEDERN